MTPAHDDSSHRPTRLRSRVAGLVVTALVAFGLIPVAASPAIALTEPTATTTVVRVQLADVRVASGLTPADVDHRYAEGQTLLLAEDAAGEQPVDEDWATCTVGAEDAGQCEFIVPDTQPGGSNAEADLWVVFGEPIPGSPAAENTYVVDSFYTSNRTGQRGQIPYSIPLPSAQIVGGELVQLPLAVDPVADTALAQRDTFGTLGLSVNNPALTPACRPLNVAIVFDLSSSIGEANLPLVKEAGRVLVDGLVGSGSSVGLFTFSRYAPSSNTSHHPLTPVDGGRDELVDDINSYVTSSGTNWDRGLASVAEDAVDYDIAFVLTDGLPDKSGLPYMPASSTFPQRFAELDQGRYSANQLKAEGTRVFGIGINLDGAASVPAQPETSIQAVSGLGEYPAVPAAEADYASADWDRLVSLTSELIDAMICRTEVIVHKDEISHTGSASPGDGWSFDIGTSADAAVSPSPTIVTDETGTAAADITTTGPSPIDVSISETQRDDWRLEDVSCTVDGEPVDVAVSTHVDIAGVVPGSTVECFFVNRDDPVESTITVHKIETAAAGQRPGEGWVFDAGVTASEPAFSPDVPLTTDSGGSATTTLTTGSAPFDVSIGERPRGGWSFDSVSCTVNGAEVDVAQNPEIELGDVAAGSAIDCTFVNSEDPLTTTIEIEKIESLAGTRTPGENWEFELASSVEGVEFTPSGPFSTGDDGQFATTVTTPNAPFDLNVEEIAQDGWTFSDVACTIDGVPAEVEQGAATTVTGITPGSDVSCVFVNVADPVDSMLVIEKIEDTADGEQPGEGWAFDVTDLADDALFTPASPLTTNESGLATTTITTGDVPFDLEINERPEEGWTLRSVACTIDGDEVELPPQAPVQLAGVAPGSDIRCVFVNEADPVEPSETPTPTETPTGAPSPTPTGTPAPTPTPTGTPDPTESPAPEPTATTTPTPSPSAQPTPTGTPTETPTETPDPEPTPTTTPAPSPSAQPTPTGTPTETPDPTETSDPEPTPTITSAPSPSAQPTDGPEPTAEPTPDPTITAGTPPIPPGPGETTPPPGTQGDDGNGPLTPTGGASLTVLFGALAAMILGGMLLTHLRRRHPIS